MAFSDPGTGRRLAPVAAVTLVHLAIGYALVSGLAMKVVRWVPMPTIVGSYPADPPPPPETIPPAPKQNPRVVPVPQEPVIVPTSLNPVTLTDPMPAGSQPVAVTDMPVVEPVPMPPAPDLSRAAAPRGDRAGWISNDDYPQDALRAEAEGIVAIRVAIGVDGRVAGCTVTRSSGNRSLDAETCRLYTTRAHFDPARDRDGTAIASQRDDRVRWQLP